MYIDPTLFTLGVMSVTNAIKDSNHNNSHTSCNQSYSHSNTTTINEEKLAEEIVKAQERKKLRDAKFEREYEKSLECYCIKNGRDYDTRKEMKQLQFVLQKELPICLPHKNDVYKIFIHRPDNNCAECYVKIGNNIVSAYILQLYMHYFGSTTTECHREIISNELYFIIKEDFLRQLGWIK